MFSARPPDGQTQENPMRLDDLTVGDLMSTALITAKPDEPIDGPEMDMRLASVRHVPVVDGRNHVIGILSDRDVLRVMAGRATRKRTVRSVMTHTVQTVSEDAPASEAASMLLHNKFGCVPVENDDGQLVGIITETDFLRIAHRALLGETPEEIIRHVS
jgi:CBS domain-containing protein